MKRFLIAIALLAAMPVAAQTDWKKIDKMFDEGSFQKAYAEAESVFKKAKKSNDLLTAAWYMAKIAAEYQEDYYDSAEMRYRTIIPRLDAVDRAVCYAFWGERDSALLDEEQLKNTSSERVKPFCQEREEKLEGVNETPTVFDVVVQALVEQNQWDTTLLQKLIDFHANDDDCIRMMLDLQKYKMQEYKLRLAQRRERLQGYINKYRGSACPRLAQFYYGMGMHLNDLGHKVDAVKYCDTAIALFPKSFGSTLCTTLRSMICRASIEFYFNDNNGIAYPGRPSLHELRYRNLSRVHFAVYAIESLSVIDSFFTRPATPLHRWSQEIEDDGSHLVRPLFFSVPALPLGNYLLVASVDDKFGKEDANLAIQCVDISLCNIGNNEFLMVESETGAPIEGQNIVVYSGIKPIDTLVTHTNGRFRTDKGFTSFLVQRGGVTFKFELWIGGRYYYQGGIMQPSAQLMVDRPVYRPGDTLHVASVLYESDNVEGRVLPRRKATLDISDPNSKICESLALEADEHGVVNALFVIPKDALAGSWYLKLSSDALYKGLHFRVEEYKQPKFTVSLKLPDNPEFGKPCTVRGLAKAYSGAALSRAKVKYTVSREGNTWRWWGASSYESFSDSTVTAEDGTFDISFIPQPDSTIDPSYRPVFLYSIQVEVTDLNGETHEANSNMNIGYFNEVINLTGEERVNSLSSISYSFCDLNNNPLAGDVMLTVEKLRMPDKLLLSPPVAFPHCAYSAEERGPKDWATQWSWQVKHHADGSKLTYSVDLADKKLPSGVYRITAVGARATDTQYVTLVLPDERTLPTGDLLWAEAPSEVALGSNCTVRYASAFDDTHLFYLIAGPDGQEITSEWLSAGPRIRSFSIPVDSSLLGGFSLFFVTIREGVRQCWKQTVEVPFNHKKLNVEISTFRDKLLPGEEELWTIKVSSPAAQRPSAPASLIMTMYDDALNSYHGGNNWSFNPWRGVSYHNVEWLEHRTRCKPYFQEEDDNIVYDNSGYYNLTLSDGLFGYGRRRYRKNRALVSGSASKNGMVTMQGGVRKRTGVNYESVELDENDEEEMSVWSSGNKPSTPEPVIRTDFSTLAFFVSDLRTDSAGIATYRFRVPELLTRWNIRGLAFTDDLRIGALNKYLVTAKPLMVQPNIPRFLRHGDSLQLMAKVVNLTDTARLVRVAFSCYNAADGVQLDSTVQWVTVEAKGSTPVTFQISNLPGDLHVLTYQITARTAREHPGLPILSDGERGQIPVVSNRQAVTVSQSLYVNGPGSKSFTFHLSPFTSTTAQPQLLSAEVVGNPFWLAIKSLPYLKSLENPSTLYLANQYFVNSRGLGLGNMFSRFDSVGTAVSPLSRNEDVKQTLLEATPWVMDAEREEEQLRNLSRFLDTATLNEELRTLDSQLRSRQNPDGGWPWMPEDPSSLWVTQQVLTRLAETSNGCDEMSVKALEYVKREQQLEYEKYIKPYLKKGNNCTPIHVDYLYMRSFYGADKTEAYRFHYSNALKTYRQYNDLYTQAQLALIFYRNGNKKEARDLIRRLKQKSLVSDEMGMYWRDNRGGWFWYQRPIETQALLIDAFAEITPNDTIALSLMQQWLLKQRQTTHWGNDLSTTRAIEALMRKGRRRGSDEPEKEKVSLIVFGDSTLDNSHFTLSMSEEYRSHRWTGAALDTLLGKAADNPTVTLAKTTSGIAWGSVCYQYIDDIDKIPASETGITLKRSYCRVGDGKRAEDAAFNVGDRVRVRIEISCDRTMEYLELVDGRPSCVEPLSTQAGWCWYSGLRYYVVVKNCATHCYINRLEKGKYVVEYDVYVTNPGTFLAGPVTMQCMYAPEFRAVAPATRMTVE